MDTDRPLKRQRGQALLELLLLAPLFFSLILATVFFVHALTAHLTLIQTCRDTALGLARAKEGVSAQAVLAQLVDERGLAGLGHWQVQVEAAVPGAMPAKAGALAGLLGDLVGEKLTVQLDLPTPRWLPGGGWRLQEHVVFKRDPWIAPYDRAFRSLMK